MTLRQLLILFSSATATSLIILLLFFGLFFESFDITFDTKLPDAAPDFQNWNAASTHPSVTDALGRAVLNVPVESAAKPRINNTGSKGSASSAVLEGQEELPLTQDSSSEAGIGIYPSESTEVSAPQESFTEEPSGSDSGPPVSKTLPEPPKPKISRPKPISPAQSAPVIPPTPEMPPVPENH